MAGTDKSAITGLQAVGHAIVRGIANWCDAEGIAWTKRVMCLMSTALRRAEGLVCLDLGDTQVWVYEERVIVRMPHRVVEFTYTTDESASLVVGFVTKVIETG